MNKYRMFICGIVLGSMIAGGMSYASDKLQISVKLPIVSYWIDGKEVTKNVQNRTVYSNGTDQVPTTIQYKGTNYVPVRFIAGLLGKEVDWDDTDSSIHLRSVDSIPFERMDLPEMPESMEEWFRQSLFNRMGQVRQSGDDTYILLTRGEKRTGGYSVKVKDIKQYSDGTTILIELDDPSPEELVTQPITYPYDMVKIKGKLQEPVSFVTEEGAEFPKIVGLDSMGDVMQKHENMILFRPHIQDDQLILDGIVRAFEGVLQYDKLDRDGKQISHETIQAAGGAPNWGYYQKSIPISEIDFGMSVKFQTFSPQDGSTLDELSIPLDTALNSARNH